MLYLWSNERGRRCSVRRLASLSFFVHFDGSFAPTYPSNGRLSLEDNDIKKPMSMMTWDV